MTESLQLEGQREYEISFLLISEEAISEITNTLLAANMTIGVKSPLVSLKLAYPIKKHTSAFLGSCIFTGLPENIKQIEATLALNNKVLRILIMTPPVKVNAREPRVASEARSEGKSIKASEAHEASIVSSAPEARMPILSNEGLEKKLEEILK